MKKLSVISVTYNCAGLIGKTLESVAGQNPDLVEHIVIDGGSIDGTVELVSGHRAQLAHFVSEPDRGIFDAMNKGVAAASGDWVLFLNAGDVFHEAFQLSDLGFDWPPSTEFVVFPYIVEGDSAPHLPDLNMRFGMPTSHQGMFISTKAARETKLDSRFKVAADYDFFLKRLGANNAGKGLVFVEKRILSRVQPGGYSAANLKKMIREYQQIILKNLGLRKAAVYFFWCRPFIFRAIKAVLPRGLFDGLKERF